jgi:hypothetical protein
VDGKCLDMFAARFASGRRNKTRGASKLEPITVEAKLQNLDTSPKPFQLNVLLQFGVCETLYLLK